MAVRIPNLPIKRVRGNAVLAWGCVASDCQSHRTVKEIDRLPNDSVARYLNMIEVASAAPAVSRRSAFVYYGGY